MGAAADCETIVDGLLGQPVNTITCVAFLVGGTLLLRKRPLRWVGLALIATGIGSFLFHGPMPTGSEWAHDTTLAWLIVVIGGLGEPWEKRTHITALLTIGIVFALLPAIADPAAVALTFGALYLVLRRDSSLRSVLPLTLIAVAALVGRLGATGNPLCDPESLLQMHGIWHFGAAVGVTWWAFKAT